MSKWRSAVTNPATPLQNGSAPIRCPAMGPSKTNSGERTAFSRSGSKRCEVLEQHRNLVLSNAAFDRFIAELDKPAIVVEELAELFQKHSKLSE